MHSSILDHTLTLPQQLHAIRESAGKGIGELAQATGLSRITVSAAEGKTDARLSSVVALFDALGYALLPVPKHLAKEVASFVNNGGAVVSLPAGTEAPMSVGQRSFHRGGEESGA